ncbi:MAG TPA: glycosyltransferase family 1 protein, partial [Stellaceae bacterium]|nr:glycosyltransferase family 1 protein [Stellaceae bacterium]
MRDDLGAAPLFRHPPVDPDPLIGWLTTFKQAAESMYQELSRIRGLAAEDLVYLRLPGPAALMALVKWAAGIGRERLPTVAVDVGWDPGLDGPSPKTAGLPGLRDLRQDARGLLYRYAAARIDKGWGSRLRFVVFDSTMSAPFGALLARPVETLPMPISAGAMPRLRGTRPTITIALLGHQRPEHGYHLAPAIIEELLRRRGNIHVLAHNSAPAEMPVPQQALRELARRDRRVTLVEHAV